MNLQVLLKFLTISHFVIASQNSHVQDAKQRIRAEVRSALGHDHSHHQHHAPHRHYHHHGSHWHEGQRVYRLHRNHNGHRSRWSGRRKSIEHHHFTPWTAWSKCDSHDCVRRRERYCKAKRKCGHTKHLEEQKCWSCHPAPIIHESIHHEPAQQQQQQQQSLHSSSHTPQSIIINAAAASGQPTLLYATTEAPPPAVHVHQIHIPVLQQENVGHHKYPHQSVDADPETTENEDFFVINEGYKYRKPHQSVAIDEEDYEDLEDDELEDTIDDDEDLSSETIGPVRSLRTLRQHKKLHRGAVGRRHKRRQNSELRRRNLPPGDDGIEGDVFQYEDFDLEQDMGHFGAENQYSDSYEDSDYAEFHNNSLLSREKATPNGLVPKHRRLYSKWSRWTKCSPKCTTRRYKKCRVKEQCGREVLREIAYCYTEGSFCQQWLQAQVQKSPPYEITASRRRDIDGGGSGGGGGSQSNSIVSDFIMNGKGYRGPEYTPMKLKCGIAPIRSNKRNMYNMLKIIGGKAARKGEWPWQVAIFNRFKEAFCGGTLIAPHWVLTAAHCVRKVLFVRIGEHNLDYEDGTELQLRVVKSFKHPSFDKKTVDSDVALLKLPKPVNATTWIGYSCLPRPFQPLPKNVECTVIGWGKRRNRDAAGTSVLHQASVPIIPMENCRSVYQDYTITKNMFCAGHRRGRIDTCAGDSGGPLLCRDTTKPNHPWTMFGITSFGDGCAKRNKFGIYAKVPNYVDWVWSVINCNGNCKLQQRNYGI